jgi:signal transduction histidine kinase
LSVNAPGRRGSRWIRPWTIAGGYGLVAGTWILTSGEVLDLLIGRDGQARSTLEEVKGLAFVGVTSVILWLVMRRFARSERQLTAQSARLAQFPQLSPNPVVELGEDGSILSVNLAGSVAARDAGGAIADLLPVEFPAIARDCIHSGEVRPQIPVTRAGRTWEWTIFPVIHPPGAYAFGIERTEQQRLQAQVHQAARMESVGRMAAGLAHDLNNILTAIGGYASLALMESPPGSAPAEELGGIRGEVDRASLLVKKLLSISRLRSVESTRERIDLVEHVCQLSGTLKHLVPSRIRLSMERSAVPAFVDVDIAELEQALLNLVANAVDAIEAEGEITVATGVSGGEVTVSVRDTGTGIEPELLPSIFEPFFTTKDEGRGTGLGLAGTRVFAHRNGGRVEVETAPGAGTLFSIVLPLVPACESATG